ncbi:MAG: SRPBCC family protein [Theionarchaea archaeon]|nr:SRPBCC family protein [Theionarchaea archaeon]MBU7040865.1 SRPBCC family protein [Theionarchaea archaeon]
MGLFDQLAIRDSIEIRTTPEKIWEFFYNLEQNYTSWHPEHVVFKWTEGPPMESGSAWYAEEVSLGKLKKLKGTIDEVIPNRKIVFKNVFPVSLVSPRFEWHIEPTGSNSVFTAINYLRAEGLYRTIARETMETAIKASRKHMKEEGENLRKILEHQE